MRANHVQIRRKGKPQKQMNKLSIFVGLAILIILVCVAAVAVGTVTGKFSIFGPSFEVVADGDHDIIKVPAGGNLQAAISRAKSGDVVELVAGASYYGEIVLPNKPLTDYVTIRSSGASQLPENKRVDPSQATAMAKILSKGEGKPAVSAQPGAHHYRFVGIEFAPNNSDYIYNLVLFGAEQKTRADVPHDLEIDRSYLHPFRSGVTRRGIALNSAATTIKNSYIEGFGFASEETQGVCGWTGTKDVKVINNYIEGGAENIMFGGSEPASAELIPEDIEVRGNYLKKPDPWKGKVSLKTLFELKDAKRVKFVENYLENNWVGVAFRITVRNENGGAPFSTIEDVLIKDNVINGAGEGINILGTDNNYPSQVLKRLTVTNNVFLNIGGNSWEGSGYFIQVAGGEDILIANNTAFNMGNIATFYGDIPKNFVFRDNIAGHGEYGIHGIDTNSSTAQAFFRNNVFVNNRRVSKSDLAYPKGNFFVDNYESLGFTSPAKSDYRLTSGSRYKGKGTDKTDIGSDLNAAAIIPR